MAACNDSKTERILNFVSHVFSPISVFLLLVLLPWNSYFQRQNGRRNGCNDDDDVDLWCCREKEREREIHHKELPKRKTRKKKVECLSFSSSMLKSVLLIIHVWLLVTAAIRRPIRKLLRLAEHLQSNLLRIAALREDMGTSNSFQRRKNIIFLMNSAIYN